MERSWGVPTTDSSVHSAHRGPVSDTWPSQHQLVPLMSHVMFLGGSCQCLHWAASAGVAGGLHSRESLRAGQGEARNPQGRAETTALLPVVGCRTWRDPCFPDCSSCTGLPLPRVFIQTTGACGSHVGALAPSALQLSLPHGPGSQGPRPSPGWSRLHTSAQAIPAAFLSSLDPPFLQGPTSHGSMSASYRSDEPGLSAGQPGSRGSQGHFHLSHFAAQANDHIVIGPQLLS